jgi:uncharacterized protein YjbI with pentapeptide repeats
MGQEYSVIYLWEEDKNGHYKVKHPCKVCQAIGRNVIEPVAVFVPKGKEEKYREKLLKIESEGELQKELEELYKDVDWYKKPETHLTCILHCDKENSIWIKNFDEYKEYAKRRDEAISKKEPFEEDLEIEWDENLVKEFWRKVRAYRFAVDYFDLWRKANGNWNRFLECFAQDVAKNTPELLEILNKNKKKIVFNLTILSFSDEYNFMNFTKVIFPKFEKFIKFISKLKPSSESFFYNTEEQSFRKNISFTDAKFLDETVFSNIKFEKRAYFEKTIFNKDLLLRSVSFKNEVIFRDVNFLKNLFLCNVTFQKKIIFEFCNFIGEVYLKHSTFEEKAEFLNLTYYKDVIFDYVSLSDYSQTFFFSVSFKEKFILDSKSQKNTYMIIFSEINLDENTEIFLKNLRVSTLHFSKLISAANQNKFIVSNIQVFESLILRDFFLEKAKFINFNLSQAQQIEIEDSDLTEAKFINTNWGEISEKRICKDLFKKYPLKAKEIYRQLKYALDQQADYITANQFYALEMKAYERYLEEKLFGKPKNYGTFWEDLKILFKTIKNFNKLPQEKYEFLIFKLHKLISEFGLSWVRPLSILIFLTLIVSFLGSFPSWGKLFMGLDFLLMGYLVGLILYETLLNKGKKPKWLKDLPTFSLIWIILSSLIIETIKYNPFGALDHIAETLNIFKTFKGTAENGSHFAGFKFIYTLYVIFGAVLIYQMIVAIRRRVKR